jgi:3-hydroxyisobutyrate dehydrogenase-like beta-hydroxyacid dehydrogenase
VFGLGSMGYGIASSLLRAGHTTLGLDARPEPEARFRAEGGVPGDLAEVAGGLDAVVVVVLNAAQTEAVLFGLGGVVPLLRPGAVILSCATGAPDFARAMAARAAESGVLYLDAPISGGAAKAASGQLSVMASGRPEAFAAARPVLDAIAETVFELGDEAGAGSAM